MLDVLLPVPLFGPVGRLAGFLADGPERSPEELRDSHVARVGGSP
ncbi:hypothetical protein PV371_03075 [Streptomyces sp. TX20-6-3]|nr:hypothetical protein [Streptomyces sp. TX20-6-3]MDX2558637.1 hypothetical protein [Streptomyces sp. TX20-6-3]